MKLCFRKFRETDCFCSRYDENRQTMFYCGFFTALAGFIWFLIGFGLRCAFFTQALGPSVTAVACGIMVVGIMVLILGFCFTLSIICAGKSYNKTNCISSSSSLPTTSSVARSRLSHSTTGSNNNKKRKEKIFFDSPMDPAKSASVSPYRNDSFSSTELNPSLRSDSLTVSSTSTTSISPNTNTNPASYNSNIAFIA